MKKFRHAEAKRKNNPLAGIAPTYEVRERCLFIIEDLEAVIEANLTRADRPRQSILSQAFAGKFGNEAFSMRNAALG